MSIEKQIKKEVALLKEIDLNQFLSMVVVKEIEETVHPYFTQTGYSIIDTETDESTYVTRIAYLSSNPYSLEDLKKDIFASEVLYNDYFEENVTQALQKSYKECFENFGIPDLLICLEPNVWFLVQPTTFGIIQNGDRKSLLCYQPKKNMIIKMNK